MKRFILTSFFVLLLTSMGCLSVESYEIRIQFHGEDEPVTVTMIYRDISSAEAKLEDVQNDFESLMSDWKGDEYLLEQARDGFVVKERAVTIEDGKLVAYEKGVTNNLGDFKPIKVSNGERILLLEKDDDYELVESNGKIFKTDNNTLLVWPEDLPELYMKHKAKKISASHVTNRPVMIKMFEEFIAKEKQAPEKNH
jgi:hypothetical protein